MLTSLQFKNTRSQRLAISDFNLFPLHKFLSGKNDLQFYSLFSLLHLMEIEIFEIPTCF